MAIFGFLSALLFFLLPIGVITIIIFVAVNSKKEKKESFETIIRTIYLYLILIITFVMFIFGIITLISNGVNILFPVDVSNKNTEHSQIYLDMIMGLSLLIVSSITFFLHNRLIKKL